MKDNDTYKNQTGRLARFLAWDERVSSHLVLPESATVVRRFAMLLGHSCDSWFWLVGLLLLWLLSKPPLKSWAFFWALGLALLAAAVLALKFLIRRPRPAGEWGQIYRVTDPHSFPSGHAARAAAIALLSAQFGLPWLVAFLALWALLVGLSRVALKVHYFSDVLFGWLIGVLSVLLAIALIPWLWQVFPSLLAFFTR
ncbi:MAG TPA: phosphatase PAP2 family protein [Anaerolineaceae bacterium]|nr:phosphatase PAP2 family protein [Anaerolineaceae bacterium]